MREKVQRDGPREEDRKVTVRELADLLQRIPDELQDLEVRATYDASYSTAIWKFDPLKIRVETEGYADELETFVKLPGY